VGDLPLTIHGDYTPLLAKDSKMDGPEVKILGDLPLTITEIPPERRAIGKLSEFSRLVI